MRELERCSLCLRKEGMIGCINWNDLIDIEKRNVCKIHAKLNNIITTLLIMTYVINDLTPQASISPPKRLNYKFRILLI